MPLWAQKGWPCDASTRSQNDGCVGAVVVVVVVVVDADESNGDNDGDTDGCADGMRVVLY